LEDETVDTENPELRDSGCHHSEGDGVPTSIDLPDRRKMYFGIVGILRCMKRECSTSEDLLLAAMEIEERLYRSVSTKEEYTDVAMIGHRLNNIVRTMNEEEGDPVPQDVVDNLMSNVQRLLKRTSANSHTRKASVFETVPTQGVRDFVQEVYSRYANALQDDLLPGEDEDIPDGIEPCLYVRGPRCMCVPYDDKYMVASQLLSIFALLLSWVWWVALIVSIFATIPFQILWCCRMNTTWLLASVAAALLASLVSGIAWLVFFASWVTDVDREVFTMEYNGHWGDLAGFDWECFLWASLSFVCTLLWAGSAYCMLHFVTSGKHAKWEEHHSNKYVQATRRLKNVGAACLE